MSSYRKKAPAPDPDPKSLVLQGRLVLDWELPTRLNGQDMREWIFMGPTLTLKDGLVHFGRLDLQVEVFYGADGFRIVNGLVCALESLEKTYSMASTNN